MTDANVTEVNAPATESTPSPYTALLNTLRVDLVERIHWMTIEDGMDFDEIDRGDLAHESADAVLPITTWDLVQLVSDRPALLLDTPSIEGADWWAPAMRIVVGNLYDALYGHAVDILDELEVAA